MMKNKLFLNRKVQLAFGSALLTLFAMGLISYRGMIMSSESDQMVRRSHQVLENLQDFLLAMERIESSYSGFALNGRESYVKSYRTSIISAKQNETALRNLAADNPAQQHRMSDLDRLVDQKIAFAEKVIIQSVLSNAA